MRGARATPCCPSPPTTPPSPQPSPPCGQSAVEGLPFHFYGYCAGHADAEVGPGQRCTAAWVEEYNFCIEVVTPKIAVIV